MTHVSWLAAFAAGVVSFLSPCVLPLVPGYLSFAAGGAARDARERRATWPRTLAFVSGFGAVFVALGASASAVGRLLSHERAWLEPLAGLLVIAFGLLATGWIRLPWLLRDVRVHRRLEGAGVVGAVLLGAAFAFGWSPCIGPLLGAVLTLAGTQGSVARGALLLSVYAAGLALPFLAASLAMERFLAVSRRLRPAMPWIERGGGLLLAGYGVLLLTGHVGLLTQWMPGFSSLAR